jgi:hypothetical protein
MAIKFMLLVSRQGKIRLAKWFSTEWAIKDRNKVMKEISTTVLGRNPKMCNVLDFKDFKVVYKR